MNKIFFSFLIAFILFFNFNCDTEWDKAYVTFNVGGTATNANIQYSFNTDAGYFPAINNQSLPWRISTELKADSEESYILSLCGEKVTGDAATISLEIFVDGKLENTAVFNGAFEKKCIQVGVFLHGYNN